VVATGFSFFALLRTKSCDGGQCAEALWRNTLHSEAFQTLAPLLILHLGNYYVVSSMKKYQLGEFEEVVMLTVGILYNDAYGVSIKKEIEQRLSRKVSVGALQSALKRLEDKGYLKSHEGETTQERAGRPKRYFVITALHSAG
jgi:PadR family transcriptional regulator, regulatory protein PadR